MSTDTTIVPAATLVTDAEPHTPEWCEARRSGITATDVPKILGVSTHGTGTSVWARKLGLLPEDEAGEEAAWGTRLEPLIADDWADRHSTPLTTVGILAATDHPWRRCALDRITTACPDDPWSGPCPVEIKTRSAWKGAQWRDDVPDDVLAQVTWQMAVTGWRHVHVAALIGGQHLTEHRVDWDQAVADLCVREASRIWADVQSLTRPVEEPTALLARVLDAIYPNRDGAKVLTRAQADLLAVNYTDACARIKAAESDKVAARAAILDALEDADTAVIRDTAGIDIPVFTYKSTTRRAYVKNVPEATYRTLRLVKGALDDTDK